MPLGADRIVTATSQPSSAANGQPTVAIVGAGIAGLAAARTLADQGARVHVFERGRGAGGRTAHRRAGDHTFDHGAQYFTARDPRFADHCVGWARAGLIAPWPGRIVAFDDISTPTQTSPLTRYVGVPGMNAMAKHLAQGLELTTGCAIERIGLEDGGWHLSATNGAADGRFDAVILAMPPEQATQLVPLHGFGGDADQTRSEPCWCAMAAFDSPLPLDFDGAFVNDPAIDWAARDSSKPGRPGGERWVIHAGAAWSAERLEQPPDEVATAMLDRFFRALGCAPLAPAYLAGHRWSLARPAHELDMGCLWNSADALAVCGDWCLGGRVEGAFLSGLSAAECVSGTTLHQGMG